MSDPVGTGPPDRVQPSRQALLDAALRLLADRTPSEISGRDLAGEAGVNYGLVHYYFGSKDDVLRAASTQHMERLVETVMEGGTRAVPADAVMGDRAVWAVTGHMALEPTGPLALRETLPVIEAYRRIVERADPDGDPVHHKAAIAAMVALLVGWPIFGPQNTGNGGLDPEGEGLSLARLRDHVLSLQVSVGLGDAM